MFMVFRSGVLKNLFSQQLTQQKLMRAHDTTDPDGRYKERSFAPLLICLPPSHYAAMMQEP